MSEYKDWKHEVLTSVETEVSLFQEIVSEIKVLTDELREYLSQNSKIGEMPVSYDKPSDVSNARWKVMVGHYSHVFGIDDVKRAQKVYVLDDLGFSNPETTSVREALIRIIKENIPFRVN